MKKLYKLCPHCHAIHEVKAEDEVEVFRGCPICGVFDYLENETKINNRHWLRQGIDNYFLEK